MVGSVTVGWVTSSDGSLISRPRLVISSKVRSQCRPKKIVWWPSMFQARVTPALRTTADGDQPSRIGRLGVRPSSR
jgi:hypothetical protein